MGWVLYQLEIQKILTDMTTGHSEAGDVQVTTWVRQHRRQTQRHEVCRMSMMRMNSDFTKKFVKTVHRGLGCGLGRRHFSCQDLVFSLLNQITKFSTVSKNHGEDLVSLPVLNVSMNMASYPYHTLTTLHVLHLALFTLSFQF